MAIMPDWMRFTETEANELEAIRVKARARHEKARKAAKMRGRLHFPDLPYECSAAYEAEFLREKRRGQVRGEHDLAERQRKLDNGTRFPFKKVVVKA